MIPRLVAFIVGGGQAGGESGCREALSDRFRRIRLNVDSTKANGCKTAQGEQKKPEKYSENTTGETFVHRVGHRYVQPVAGVSSVVSRGGL